MLKRLQNVLLFLNFDGKV